MNRTNAIDFAEQQETNWRIVGIFSALFPLIGTGILFMLGWAYEVNWYGYFGVNVNQVNTSAQNILIQSIPSAITFFGAFFLASVSYYLLLSTYNYLFRVVRRHLKKPPAQHNFTNKQLQYYQSKDWIIVALLTESYLLLILRVIYYPNILSLNTTLIEPYEISYLKFLITISIPELMIIFLLLLLLRGIVFVVSWAISFLRKEPWKDNTGYKIINRKPQSFIWFLSIFSLLAMTLIAYNAIYGSNDASSGFRGSGRWEIQKVLVLSPVELPMSNPFLSLGCKDKNCLYGPFGLIGENNQAYILIEWQKDNRGNFLRQPGLYFIPRSDNTYLIPASP